MVVAVSLFFPSNGVDGEDDFSSRQSSLILSNGKPAMTRNSDKKCRLHDSKINVTRRR
ncbi:hypothetical protein K2173_018516 [Erythroxylum novogranatense]|uniref:Uncharacterized protein n=1 Tax=Erythroxylum novogranatense TaxID=1862640 RepID=A0AAV8UEA9_9ROSI|nr:hypothetical protein K2173_018516 [Erythroxylum novogranatense]